ncbi:hypothetical protein [Lysobacter gummosus]|uniref:hypothetical protein n=1 Tax=Lysobacter gummosus TaxID=262324 RepID=UPI00362A52BC
MGCCGWDLSFQPVHDPWMFLPRNATPSPPLKKEAGARRNAGAVANLQRGGFAFRAATTVG